MYHTQERRATLLTFPVKCVRDDAWCGYAYYFWEDQIDAEFWGLHSKKGKYDVYQATIISENVVDTVFNEAHYRWFYDTLSEMAKNITKKTGIKPTIDDVCRYINERANWQSKIDVLLICDCPMSDKEPIKGFPLRRRIQAAVYNEKCIHDFKLAD